MEFIYKNQILNTKDLKYLGGNLEGNILILQRDGYLSYLNVNQNI